MLIFKKKKNRDLFFKWIVCLLQNGMTHSYLDDPAVTEETIALMSNHSKLKYPSSLC